MALSITDGVFISSIHCKHGLLEFKKFLVKIDKIVPGYFGVHIVCDNYATHKHLIIKTWLARYLRFHVYFTPTHSSWHTQVERFFAEVSYSNALITGACRYWRKTTQLRARYGTRIQLFIWTQTGEEVRASLAGSLKRINNAGLWVKKK